jgi:hypothetical protein
MEKNILSALDVLGESIINLKDDLYFANMRADRLEAEKAELLAENARLKGTLEESDFIGEDDCK